LTTTRDGTINAGIAGLGMAGNGIVRSLARVPGITLFAAADLRENALGAFKEQYGGKIYQSFERLCDDPDVDAVWVATPTHLHCRHAVALLNAGKHVIVEKPMAVTLDECDEMLEAAAKNGRVLIAGGARSFEPAFAAMRNLISGGRLGKLAALTSWSFTTWMTRAREPHEVDVEHGGGAVYNQAAHPIDVLRLLGGGLVRSVRGMTVDTALPGRPCPGYFGAMMAFEDGLPATFVYDGYGYLNGWELTPWGETPARLRGMDATYAYRRALRSGTANEYEARELLRFGGRPATEEGGLRGGTEDAGWTPQDAGLVIATCELGEVRQSRGGLYVYDDFGRHDEPVDGGASMRHNEVAELRDAIAGTRAPLHDGRWGKATIEVLVALLESARTHREVTLKHQIPAL
jgi:phthalate 4,5-cis-dihydrodiol dehydrogenase